MYKLKKSNIITIAIIVTVVAAGAAFLFQGEYVYAVEASVAEIVEEPAAFDSQQVITEGVVTDWEIKEYTVTIVGPDVNETFVILRYYLVIEDLDTEDVILVRLNYKHNSPDLTIDSFTVGESISVEGVVKEFKFESLEVDIDIDLVILAKEIVKENDEIITILTDDDIEAFRERRQARQERRQNGNFEDYVEEITAEVLTWEVNEYNITVTGPDDFFKSKIVVRPLLLVQNTVTDEVILVKVSHPRMNITIDEEFISVGEIITLKGIIREGELNSELFYDVEYDLFLLGISMTNSDGDVLTLISRDAFMHARPHRMFGIGNRPRL